MLMAARKLQGIGLVLIVLFLAMILYPVSLRVASKRSELARVEQDIRATRNNIRYLETELGARASLRQLERWNAENFAYSAPTAAQYLKGERQLAELGAFAGDRPQLAVVAPVQVAAAMMVDTGAARADSAIASDSTTAQSDVLATQVRALPASVQVAAAAKPGMKVVVAAKPTARDRYAERTRMIDKLLEKDSPAPVRAAASKARAAKPAAAKTPALASAKAPAGPAAAPPKPAKTPPTAVAKRPDTGAAKKTTLAKAEPKKAEARTPAPAKAAPEKLAVKKSAAKKLAAADKPRRPNSP